MSSSFFQQLPFHSEFLRREVPYTRFSQRRQWRPGSDSHAYYQLIKVFLFSRCFIMDSDENCQVPGRVRVTRAHNKVYSQLSSCPYRPIVATISLNAFARHPNSIDFLHSFVSFETNRPIAPTFFSIVLPLPRFLPFSRPATRYSIIYLPALVMIHIARQYDTSYVQ